MFWILRILTSGAPTQNILVLSCMFLLLHMPQIKPSASLVKLLRKPVACALGLIFGRLDW